MVRLSRSCFCSLNNESRDSLAIMTQGVMTRGFRNSQNSCVTNSSPQSGQLESWFIATRQRRSNQRLRERRKLVESSDYPNNAPATLETIPIPTNILTDIASASGALQSLRRTGFDGLIPWSALTAFLDSAFSPASIVTSLRRAQLGSCARRELFCFGLHRSSTSGSWNEAR